MKIKNYSSKRRNTNFTIVKNPIGILLVSICLLLTSIVPTMVLADEADENQLIFHFSFKTPQLQLTQVKGEPFTDIKVPGLTPMGLQVGVLFFPFDLLQFFFQLVKK